MSFIDDLDDRVKQVYESSSDQALLTDAILALQQGVKDAQNEYSAVMNELEKERNLTRSLRDTNQKLFLKVTGDDIINGGDDGDAGKREPLTFDKLFNDLGVKKNG